MRLLISLAVGVIIFALYGAALSTAFYQWLGPDWALASIPINVFFGWQGGCLLGRSHAYQRELTERRRYWGSN